MEDLLSRRHSLRHDQRTHEPIEDLRFGDFDGDARRTCSRSSTAIGSSPGVDEPASRRSMAPMRRSTNCGSETSTATGGPTSSGATTRATAERSSGWSRTRARASGRRSTRRGPARGTPFRRLRWRRTNRRVQSIRTGRWRDDRLAHLVRRHVPMADDQFRWHADHAAPIRGLRRRRTRRRIQPLRPRQRRNDRLARVVRRNRTLADDQLGRHADRGAALPDLDGDGRDDVFNAHYSPTDETNYWRVSYGGTGRWQTINSASESLEDLRFGDFDGDGRSDVFTVSEPLTP